MFHPDGPSFLELAQQAMSSTERGYDLLAPKFEFTPFRTPNDLIEPLAPLLGEPGSLEAAVDLCCGTGATMRMLRPLCTSHVTGIDMSQGMLDQAERELEDSDGDAELRFLRDDVRKLELDGEFDVATCFGAFGHLLEPDQPAFARSVHRILKPGGRFVFVTGDHPTPLHPFWWAARGFNWAMHVRNALWEPPFIMFYLTFTLPHAKDLLRDHGFEVDILSGVYRKYQRAKVVIATKR